MANAHTYHKLVDFNPTKDKLVPIDFSEQNKELISIDLDNTASFSSYIQQKLRQSEAKFGIGGYNEVSSHFSPDIDTKMKPAGFFVKSNSIKYFAA